jgi:ABC-type antimicrobial peptide transport system permease subunit
VSAPAARAARVGAAPFERSWLLTLPFPVRRAIRRWRGMVGMVIGVGVALGMVLTLMGLLGTSMGSVIGDFPLAGANTYIAVEGGQLIPLQRGANPGTIEQATSVLSKVRGLPGVQAAVGALSTPLRQEAEGPGARYQPARFVPTIGVDGDPSEIPGLLLLDEGRWLRRANEVVLGRSLSASKKLRIGDALRMNGQNFEVVGIGRLRGFGPPADVVAYVDARTLRQRADVGDILNYIAVRTTDPAAVGRFAADRSLRSVGADELLAETYAGQDYQSAVVVYWVMDLFIMFVAGLFVSNMLARSVAERRLEFGTLRAIGLSSRSILIGVAAEALLIIVASFAVGVLMSLALGEAMNIWLAPTFNLGRMFSPDPVTYLTIFALSLGLGLIAGFFPARAATRVDPLDVLRQA